MFHLRKYLQHNIKSDYFELTVAHSLQAFATGMIGIFIPIYFLNNGFSVSQVLFIFGLQNLFYIFHTFLTPKIIKRIGVKHSMLSRGPVVILNILLLKLVPVSPLFAYLTIFTQGMSMYYWVPLHYLFSKSTKKSEGDKKYAFFSSARRVMSFTSPLIGALIIFFSSYQFLFNFSGVLLVFATIPLLFSKDVKVRLRLFEKKSLFENKDFLVKTSFNGIASWVIHLFWPLTIFLKLGESLSVGFSASLLLLSSIFMTYIISFTKKRNKFLLFSVFFGFFLFPIASIVNSVALLVLFSILLGLYDVLLSTPILLLFYSCERKFKDLVLWREVFLHGTIGLFALFISVLPVNLLIPCVFVLLAFLQLLVIK